MKKRMLSLALAALMLLCALPLSASAAHPFTDIPDGIWYEDAVDYVYQNGLFDGTTATTFTPEKAMTRGMFVQVLANMTTNYDKTYYKARSSYYTDVHQKSWMSGAVRWASDARLVNGTSTTGFSPEQSLKREQMALMLYNYVEKSGNSISYSNTAAEAFPDYSAVSSWAKQAMAWAVDNGVINGSNGRLNPKGTATRAQVAQLFMNTQDLLVNKTIDIGTPEPTKANIAMLFSRNAGLNMGKLALEYDYDNPLYIQESSSPYYNYRVIGMKNEYDITGYLLSFLTYDVTMAYLDEGEFYERNGQMYATTLGYSPGTWYNGDSVKIASGSDGTYMVSIDFYEIVSLEYAGTKDMQINYEHGEYKITGIEIFYELDNPAPTGKGLPVHLSYKTW